MFLGFKLPVRFFPRIPGKTPVRSVQPGMQSVRLPTFALPESRSRNLASPTFFLLFVLRDRPENFPVLWHPLAAHVPFLDLLPPFSPLLPLSALFSLGVILVFPLFFFSPLFLPLVTHLHQVSFHLWIVNKLSFPFFSPLFSPKFLPPLLGNCHRPSLPPSSPK